MLYCVSYRRYRLTRSNFCPLCMLWTVLEMRINSLRTEAVFISCKASCLRYFIEELAFRDPNKSLSIISLEGWTNPRGSSVESSVRQQTLGIASIRRDAKKRRDALHSLKKFTKIFRRLIDRNWEKNRDKKWSFETDMSSRPLGDRPHKHRFTGRSLRGQLNLHQLMHRPHVAVLRDLCRSSVEITRTHTHTLIYHCWSISCFVSGSRYMTSR